MSWNPSNWIAAALVALAPAPLLAEAGKPAVVLVHGIFDSGKKMAWLAHQFDRAGYETFCPSLTPSNGSIPLEESAAQLDASVLEHFGRERPLHVIGFSMGGLISRYWLSHYPVRARVLSYATLSAPHQGTLFARALSSRGVAQMRRNSPFLQELARSDALFATLHPLSLYTPLDLIILPASSSRWPVATNQVYWSLFHPLMVFSPAISRRLLENMRDAEQSRIASLR